MNYPRSAPYPARAEATVSRAISHDGRRTERDAPTTNSAPQPSRPLFAREFEGATLEPQGYTLRSSSREPIPEAPRPPVLRSAARLLTYYFVCGNCGIARDASRQWCAELKNKTCQYCMEHIPVQDQIKFCIFGKHEILRVLFFDEDGQEHESCNLCRDEEANNADTERS
jgi:hypothetical protein